MRTTFIYALKEPDTGEIRYVGKADDPGYRFSVHLSLRINNRRGNWIFSVLGRGLKPNLEILDEVPIKYWQQWEVAYIEFFKEQGCNLVNGTPGGEGAGSGEDHPRFGKKHSLSAKEKISQSKTGVSRPLEAVEKTASANRGKPRPLEVREKIAASNTGKVRTLESRQKQSASRMGMIIPPEQKDKMSAVQTLRRDRERQEKILAEMWK